MSRFKADVLLAGFVPLQNGICQLLAASLCALRYLHQEGELFISRRNKRLGQGSSSERR
jgi:hypothetical protein